MSRGGGLRSLLLTAVLCCAVPLARADVVVVVAANSPLVGLSRAELADIFLGRLTRLPNGTTAVPLDLPDDSSLRAELYAKLARMSPAQLKAYWSKLIFTGRGRPPRALPDAAAVLRTVRSNPAAVGYVERSLVDKTVRVLH